MAIRKNITLFIVFILSANCAFSQERTIYSQNATGTIAEIGRNTIFNKIDAVKNINRSRIPSLRNCITSQIKIFHADSIFHPPKGFIAQASFHTESDPFAKSTDFPPCMLSFGFYYLENDQKSGSVKKSMDGTLIGMETNNLYHFFRQVGNYWKDCDELNLPLFFEEPPVSDSTDDYIELDFRHYAAPHITPNTPFRIILRNHRPPFIPLARKEFLQYLIAQKNAALKTHQGNIKDDQKSINDQQKLLSNPLFQSRSETIKKTIVQIQKNILKEEDNIKSVQQLLNQYQKTASSMSSQEAALPVRVDNSKIFSADPLLALVPAGRKEGTALYKINPDYYDKSTNASGAQLIIVYYSLPRDFGSEKLNYLEQKTVDVFNRLDYHALKVSMQ